MSVPQIEKRKLSGSTDGRPIAIAATGSPGTLIHTAQAGVTDGSYDEVWLWVWNNTLSVINIVLQYGGTGSSDLTAMPVPATSGPLLIVPGLVLQNSLVARMYADASGIVVNGFVNKLTA